MYLEKVKRKRKVIYRKREKKSFLFTHSVVQMINQTNINLSNQPYVYLIPF